jgi:hypothetical protein
VATLITTFDAPAAPVVVSYVFMIHVGGTRRVTSRPHYEHARITLNLVEFIRTRLFLFLMFEYNDEYDQY